MISAKKLFVALSGLVLFATSTVRAVTCTYTVPDQVLSGDIFYGPTRWDWCRQNWLDSQARGFGMPEDSWDGHGGHDACNTTKPTGRMLTGFVALEETSPTKVWPNTKDRSGNILQWGAGWAWHVIDELKTRCGDSPIAKCSNCSNFLGIGDFEIIAYVPPFFYSQNVEERASTLIHEARHWNGKEHNRSGGRDSSIGYEGAWWYEVIWLAWYAAEATPAPIALRCDAQALSNVYLEMSFASDNDIVIDVLDCP